MSREGGMKRKNEKIGERNANRTQNAMESVKCGVEPFQPFITISTTGWSTSWFGKRLISCVHNI